MTEHAVFADRIAQLSPEKRELLRKLLSSGGGSVAPPSPESDLPITQEAIASNRGQTPARQLYELVNRNLDQTPFAAHAVFLNLGYATNQSPRRSPIELPKHCLNRNCMQLALEVIGDVDLAGEVVADVGCGRGGTIALMHTYFAPERVVGVDFSSAALDFCRRTHRLRDTGFVLANAQALPLASGAFGVVTNIESASGYPDVDEFYREVFRVLNGGGRFLYADVVPTAELAERRQRLAEVGFVLESERDITTNVLLSCDETARTHRATLGGDHDEEIMGNFLALPDSAVYGQMKDGVLAYLIFVSRRPGP